MTTNQDSPNTAGAAEPVRWMYEQPRHEPRYFRTRAVRYASQGWTETPLYAHPPENPTQRPSVMPYEVVEAVAMAVFEIIKHGDDQHQTWLLGKSQEVAAAAISAIPADPVVDQIVQALEPFAICAEQIRDDEDDKEWAKFRLLIKNYRAAEKALAAYRKGHGHD